MIIGKLVREYRLKKNLTQQELAELSDLSLPFINLVENNRRNLSVDTLLRILQANQVIFLNLFLILQIKTSNFLLRNFK